MKQLDDGRKGLETVARDQIAFSSLLIPTFRGYIVSRTSASIRNVELRTGVYTVFIILYDIIYE